VINDTLYDTRHSLPEATAASANGLTQFGRVSEKLSGLGLFACIRCCVGWVP
jgi:hypothetical protein